MCGSGSKGQLGIGEECEGGMFNVTKVRDKVKRVACGEQHTLIISQDNDKVLVCGANDKLQLGNGLQQKEHIQYKFAEIEALKGI